MQPLSARIDMFMKIVNFMVCFEGPKPNGWYLRQLIGRGRGADSVDKGCPRFVNKVLIFFRE